MFITDAKVTAAILAIVVVETLVMDTTDLSPLVGGVFLLVGCITFLFLSVCRKAGRPMDHGTQAAIK